MIGDRFGIAIGDVRERVIAEEFWRSRGVFIANQAILWLLISNTLPNGCLREAKSELRY